MRLSSLGRIFEPPTFTIMLPQPPPDAPAPPPSASAIVSQKKSGWLLRGGIVSVLLILLAFVSAPTLIRCRKKADSTEAVNNARQIGLALFEFQTEYGRFPDTESVAAVRLKTESDLNLGGVSSNDFFRQLLAAGIAQSETMFYAKANGTRKPDNNFARGEALIRGECGFTYFLGARPTDNPKRPLVVTPMIPGTDRFEKLKGFDGRSIILRMDKSVSSLPIDKDGHVLIDGRNMMDPHHPIWEGHAPKIAWPDLKK
jgi:type II secretory pathway pseudopilin PulG